MYINHSLANSFGVYGADNETIVFLHTRRMKSTGQRKENGITRHSDERESRDCDKSPPDAESSSVNCIYKLFIDGERWRDASRQNRLPDFTGLMIHIQAAPTRKSRAVDSLFIHEVHRCTWLAK